MTILLSRISVLLTLSFIPFFLSSQFSQASHSGTTGAQFLQLGAGARASGMGESFVGVADDVNALFWNPAGIALLSGKEISISHHAYIQEINSQNFAYSLPTRIGTFGTGAQYLNVSDIERRSMTGDYQGNFNSSDMALTLGFARRLPWSGSAGGINVKYIRQQIDSFDAQDFAFDVGLIHKIQISGLKFGLSFLNMGPEIRFQETSSPLPSTLKTGLSWTGKSVPILLSGSVSIPQVSEISYQFGFEYWMASSFAVRSGYKTNSNNDSSVFKISQPTADSTVSRLSGLMAGASIRFYNAQMDYAFVPLGDLGNSHRITLGFTFK
ncbi:MAG: PorV/PorQ family protein [Elusimicrobia bacterium]|nr:PorV/PorQ family protein [Elusimicrobiota bacterium]